MYRMKRSLGQIRLVEDEFRRFVRCMALRPNRVPALASRISRRCWLKSPSASARRSSWSRRLLCVGSLISAGFPSGRIESRGNSAALGSRSRLQSRTGRSPPPARPSTQPFKTSGSWIHRRPSCLSCDSSSKNDAIARTSSSKRRACPSLCPGQNGSPGLSWSAISGGETKSPD